METASIGLDRRTQLRHRIRRDARRYHARVRVFGFPVLEDTKHVFPNEALAEKGALTLLKTQFTGTPDLEDQ